MTERDDSASRPFRVDRVNAFEQEQEPQTYRYGPFEFHLIGEGPLQVICIFTLRFVAVAAFVIFLIAVNVYFTLQWLF